jgi:allantoate deiminase
MNMSMDVNIEQIAANLQKNLEALGQYTATPGNGCTRLPFTKEARAAAEHIKAMMAEAGLKVWEDEAGNVFGVLEAPPPTLPVLVTGSHFDTVLNGGNFDGLAGIMAGIESARLIRQNGIALKRDLVVAAFCDEEGVRFGTGYFGSKSMLGQVTQEELHQHKDKDGVSIYQALKEYGKVPEELPIAAWNLKTKDSLSDASIGASIEAFIEAHIEQGPVLCQGGQELGLVECIVGIRRYIITVKGRADHAGTTPMDMRIDPVEVAARVISKIPVWARDKGDGTVATTGYVRVLPGGVNIIASEVQFSVDMRSRNNASIEDITMRIRDGLEALCSRNGSSYVMECKLDVSPLNLSERMLAMLEENCERRGFSYRRMISGAGHDALAIGQVLDTVMVFVPSKDGRSHCPEEWTEYRDIAKAVMVIYDLIVEMQNG